MDDEVDHFLEHFGVKGMRWGVRRNRGSNSSESKKSRRLSPKTKVALGASVAAGAIIAGKIIANNRSAPFNTSDNFPLFAARGKNFMIQTNNADALRITMEELARRAGR